MSERGEFLNDLAEACEGIVDAWLDGERLDCDPVFWALGLAKRLRSEGLHPVVDIMPASVIVQPNRRRAAFHPQYVIVVGEEGLTTKIGAHEHYREVVDWLRQDAPKDRTND